MDRAVRDLIEAEWALNLGVDPALLGDGGVHVLGGDPGRNDALSFMLDSSCIVLVHKADVADAQECLSGADPVTAFTGATMRKLLGEHAQVDGPSVHMYVDRDNFTGVTDDSATRVDGRSAELSGFLRSNSTADQAEGGFLRHPEVDDGITRYFLLRERGRVVAAGNLTEWRGHPCDVGVLTTTSERGRGLGRRLVAAMVDAALEEVPLVRYRALESNAASIAIARGLGFEPYGANFRGRRSVV